MANRSPDDCGSSSNVPPTPMSTILNPPPNEESLLCSQRSNGGDDTNQDTPQCRVSSSSSSSPASREMAGAVTPLPTIGFQDESAFTPLQRSHWPASCSSTVAVAVGGSGPHGVAATRALRIGGDPMARKRLRLGSAESGNRRAGEAARNVVSCSIYRKEGRSYRLPDLNNPPPEDYSA